MSAAEILDGPDTRVLLLCDHASNAVPADIDLGIDPHLLDLHIAWDIGAGLTTRYLADQAGIPAILGTVSRLVIDLHREPEHPGLIPVESDGHAIPGNLTARRDERIARFHAPYHAAIEDRIARHAPELIVSIHSFTPALETAPDARRPWQAGILYNRDDRAARLAIDWLRGEGIETGDNEPYSGRLLNATLNRHAEAHGIPYVAVEIRNDYVSYNDGARKWALLLQRMIEHLRNRLASQGPPAT